MNVCLVSVPVQDVIQAHEIYTTKLGFVTKEFDPEHWLAVVVSPDEPDGTALLLEPCQGSFAEAYQQSAYEANLPIIIFSTPDAVAEINRLAAAGVTIRRDLDRPEYGLTNLFEDGCGRVVVGQYEE